jgi:hypothetical protein
MAREGYSSTPPPEPYLYEQPDSQHSNRASYPSGKTQQTIPSHERYRPQDMSSVQNDAYKADPARYQQARQPIDDAVNSAFRGTDNISAISPEIINQITSQITANVMQQLRTTNLPPPANTAPSGNIVGGTTSPPPTGSPSMEYRTVYTPPSPTRPSDDHIQPPVSPTPFAAQQRSSLPNQGRHSPSEQYKAPPLSQDSQADETDHRDEGRDERADRGSRPKGPKRLSTGQDPTILEKIWGTLFDDEGQATPRLGQFLRGIAIHLIEDYEPMNSLVVSPPKMQKYYEDTKLSSELLPFNIIFDDHTSSISRLYREIEAQHHLTQAKLDERPDTPGLTPLGFERWATLLLRAYPDQEFERLQKTALDMPISNPDDRKERFPKEISRRLFPKYADLKIREKLEKAIGTHCNVTIPSRHASATDLQQQHIPTHPRAESFPQSVPNQAPLSQSARDGGLLSPVTSRSSQPPPFGTSVDRDRQTYSAAPSEGVFEDDRSDDLPTPQPIERERKPYVAQPGGGKSYDEVNRPPSPPEHLLPPPPPPPPTSRPARSGSIASHGRQNDPTKSRPIPISIHQRPGQPSETVPMTPDSATVSHHRSNSIYHQQHPYRGTRNRSPSATANGRAYEHNSQGDVSYGSYQSSADEDGRGYRAYESTREKFANDRYDASRMKAYDPHEREREREGRQRYQSTVGSDGQKAPYANDDQYYRPVGGYPQTTADGYQAYPASSYR